MKKLLTFLTLLTLFFTTAWAETAGFSLAGTTTVPISANANPATTTITGSAQETWNVMIAGTFTSSTMQGASGSKYWQMGKSNAAITSATFSTNGINGNITQIVVKCASAGGEGGSISAKVGNADFGTSSTMPAWSNNAGGDVTFSGSGSGEIIITMTPQDKKACYIQSITVTYTPGGTPAVSHNITYDNTVTGGTFSGPANANEGATVTIAANASSGFEFDSWNVYKTGDANTKVTVANNQFAMPTYDVTVSGSFKEKTKYDITVTNGTASPTRAYEDQEVTLSPTIPEGQIVDWDETEVSPEGLEIDHSSYKFTMPGEDVAVTFAFKNAPTYVFYEPFTGSTGYTVNGNDNFSGNAGGGTPKFVNTFGDFELVKGSGAGDAIKLGNGSTTGSATTPTITGLTVGKTYVLTFKAAPWASETAAMNVTATGGTLSGVSTANMTNRQWNDYTATFVASSTEATFTFKASEERFFLDEVMLDVAPTVEYNIYRTIKTNGENSTAGGWLGDWTNCTVPDGANGDDYVVTAPAGETVQFKAGTKNNYKIIASHVSAVDANNQEVQLNVVSSDDSGITFSFTMPASAVTITANFTDYNHPTLRLAGRFNGRSESNWITGSNGPEFTFDEDKDEYTIDVYFTGATSDASEQVDFFYLREGDNDLKASANGNCWVAQNGGTYTLGGSSNFRIYPGVYTITVTGSRKQAVITKVTPELSLNYPAGEVLSGTAISATSNLADLIAAIQDKDNGAEGEVSVKVCTDDSSFDQDEISITSDKTVYGKAWIGNLVVPTVSAAYTVRKFETVEPTYTEAFSENFGKFFADNNTIWTIYNSSCAKASAYFSGSATASESWLYSPYIDLTESSNPQLSFSHAGNYFFTDGQSHMAEDVKVMIRELSNDEWSGWTALEGVTYPEGNSFNFVDYTTSLTAYAGKTIQVAFKYTSTTERAGTWEIKNFKVADVYTITCNAADNGAITASPNPAAEGETVTITVTPESGYELATLVYNDGTDHDIKATKSFTMPAANVTVTATFTEKIINANDFQLVTSDSELNAGYEYIIVTADYNWAMGAIDSDANKAAASQDFTISTDKLTVTLTDNSSVNVMTLLDGRVYPNDDKKYWNLKQENGQFVYLNQSGTQMNQSEKTYLSGYSKELIINFVAGNTNYAIITEGGNSQILFSKPVGNDPGYFRYFSNTNANNNAYSRIFLYYRAPESKTLAQIESKGVVNTKYAVADPYLVGVASRDVEVDGKSYVYVWCKDNNNVTDKLVPASGVKDFMKQQGEQSGEWDQSNWVVLRFENDADAHELVGNQVTNIVGTYVDATNYMIDVESYEIGDEASYTPNVYCVANFNPSNWGVNGVQQPNASDADDPFYFFMTPKVQEYCKITFAEWNGTTFTVPTSSGFEGTLSLGWDYNEDSEGHSLTQSAVEQTLNANNVVQEGEQLPAYKFFAVVQKNTTSKGAVSGASKVYPMNLEGGEGDQVPTSINTVETGNGEVKSVKYVNVAGMVSDVPFQGVNIVVTEYSDGSRTTSKMLRK